MRKWLFGFIPFLLILVMPLAVLAQTNLRSGDNVVLSTNEIVNKDYFSSGKNVSLDGTVNGDAYLAGGEVTVNGTVNGDLLVAGGNLNINGTVTGNIRGAGGNINVNGKVGRNVSLAGGSINLSPLANIGGSVTSAGGNLNLLSPVAKGANLAGGQVNISNNIGGDINAGVGQLTLSPSAKVNGNVIYWSDNSASISPEASVTGQITKNLPPKGNQREQSYQTGKAVASGIAKAFTFLTIFSFLAALVLRLILLKLVPIYTSNLANVITTHPILSFGVGLLTLAVTPIVVILLLVTIIGIPLAMVWLVLLGFSLWLGKVFIGLVLGTLLLKNLNQKENSYFALLIGLIIYYLIGLIPVIGWLVGFVGALMGLGAILILKKNYYLELRQKQLI